MTFATPTNEASCTVHNTKFQLNQNDNPPTFFSSPDFHPSWLPVSTGDIKKTAQTRFVNSSPKSYRLMPASIESSESDRTSFVEKSSHKFMLPVTYFLEVAKLWALSNRSELECQFTQATNNSSFEPTSSQNEKSDDNDSIHSKRPICHPRPVASVKSCPWKGRQYNASSSATTEKSSAEQDLLNSINRFLETCRKKDRTIVGDKDLCESSNNVGSETRRYLSQVISLMSKNFAIRLIKQQNGFSRALEKEESRKRTVCDSLKNIRMEKETDTAQVNVFTMSSASEQSEIDSDQVVIIHIPNRHKMECSTDCEGGDSDGPTKKRPKTFSADNNDTELESASFSASKGKTAPDSSFDCFYCSESFPDRLLCARHMLVHLKSTIES